MVKSINTSGMESTLGENEKPINPMSAVIALLLLKIRQRGYRNFIETVDSIIAVLVYVIIIVLLIPFWFISIITFIEDILRDLIVSYMKMVKQDEKKGMEKFSSMIVISFLGILWLSVLIPCIPFAIIGGFVSYFIHHRKKTIAMLILLAIVLLIIFLVVPNWRLIVMWYNNNILNR